MTEHALPPRHDPTAARAPAAPVAPVELRILVVLLLADLGVGLWMRLHAERWLSFFVTHLPVLALAGAAWGLLTDDARQWLRGRARALLASRRLLVALGATLALLATLSVSCSTITVQASDDMVRVPVRVVAGERTAGDSAAFAAAPSHALTRLTSPLAARVWIPPVGRRMWVYAPGLATVSRVVVPWVPTRLHYPEDFDSLATLLVLPHPSLALARCGDAAPVLTVRNARDPRVVLLAAPLGADDCLRGVHLGFPEVARPDSASWARIGALAGLALRDTTTTTDSAARAEADSMWRADVRAAVDKWRGARAAPSALPLVIGDSIAWDLRRPDATRALLDSGSVRISHAITHVMARHRPTVARGAEP